MPNIRQMFVTNGLTKVLLTEVVKREPIFPAYLFPSSTSVSEKLIRVFHITLCISRKPFHDRLKEKPSEVMLHIVKRVFIAS